MDIPETHSFIILGLTTQGKKFRPSDWAERLCGVLSQVRATRKMRYSPYVSPGDYNGEKAVFVDAALREADADAYRFVLNFAQENDLQVVSGVCPLDTV
ncbi:MAG: DUF3579 domain-containing protein [Zoogloeaceae bacterium]|jgi:hypothetical protein|nr:DUF3579 domain-containing protein [Zoogloeaceae bacterium]